jgi:hypothetical protein
MSGAQVRGRVGRADRHAHGEQVLLRQVENHLPVSSVFTAWSRIFSAMS